MSRLLLLVSLIAIAFGQGCNSWTADFQSSTAASGTGYTTGQARFTWGSSTVIPQLYLEFVNSQYFYELYNYNTNRGATNFNSQTRYTYGGTCSPVCGLSSIQSRTPPLGTASGTTTYNTYSSGAATTCTEFKPTAGYASILESFQAIPSTGVICSFKLTDGRTFKLSNFQCTTPTFPTPPSDCQCLQKLDVWMLVDHSGSVSPSEMEKFKTFCQKFIAGLAVSSDQVNVGMSWFNTRTGLNFGLTGSLNDINRAFNNWHPICGGCHYTKTYPPTQNAPPLSVDYWECGGSSDIQTCEDSASYSTRATQRQWCYDFCTKNTSMQYCDQCAQGNTAIPLGLSGYGGQLGVKDYFYGSSSPNRNNPKIIITLTDGVANTKVNGQSCDTGSSCNAACAKANCAAEITTAINGLKTRHNQVFPDPANRPTLTFLSVGINNANELDADQLLLLADGKQANVLTSPDFSIALNYIKDLILLSCPSSNDVQQATCLSNCCGVCICGQCAAPTGCLNTNACTKQERTGLCCNTVTDTEKVCPSSDPCSIPSCDPTANSGAGGCIVTPKDCSSRIGEDPCVKFKCDTNGECNIPDTTTCLPEDCVLSGWTEWTPCTKTCGSGTRTKNQTVLKKEKYGGVCPELITIETCNTACCPVDCVEGKTYTPWATSQTCTCFDLAGQCPTGAEDGSEICTESRDRTGDIPLQCGGQDCSATLQTRELPCSCDRDCVGEWTPWQCDCTTNPPTATSTFNILLSAIGTGAACANYHGEQKTVPCNDATTIGSDLQASTCPVPCIGDWTEWSVCTCYTSSHSRTYEITQPAKNGGTPCDFEDNTPQEDLCEYDIATCPILCTADTDCNDGDACTEDLCKPDIRFAPAQKSTCVWSPFVCENPDNCNQTFCDHKLGCISERKVLCDDGSACTTEVCNPDTGKCVYTDVVCEDQTVCSLGDCDPTLGCGFVARDCNNTDDCLEMWCDVDYKANGFATPCANTTVCGSDFGIVVGITAGVAVGIAIALGFLCFAICSGATFAIAHQAMKEEDVIVNKNPMYAGKGCAGENPFHV